MLFSLLVLNSAVPHNELIFGAASFVILASIIAHGLTDTLGSRWIARRVAEEPGPDWGPPGTVEALRRAACRRRTGRGGGPGGRRRRAGGAGAARPGGPAGTSGTASCPRARTACSGGRSSPRSGACERSARTALAAAWRTALTSRTPFRSLALLLSRKHVHDRAPSSPRRPLVQANTRTLCANRQNFAGDPAARDSSARAGTKRLTASACLDDVCAVSSPAARGCASWPFLLIVLATLAGAIGALSVYRSDQDLSTGTVRLGRRPGHRARSTSTCRWWTGEPGSTRAPARPPEDRGAHHREPGDRAGRRRSGRRRAPAARGARRDRDLHPAAGPAGGGAGLALGGLVALALRGTSRYGVGRQARVRGRHGGPGGGRGRAPAAPREPVENPEYYANGSAIPVALRAAQDATRSARRHQPGPGRPAAEPRAPDLDPARAARPAAAAAADAGLGPAQQPAGAARARARRARPAAVLRRAT